MRKLMITSALSTAALFAAANEGAGSAGESTPATPAFENKALAPITDAGQLEKLQKAMEQRTKYDSFEAAFEALNKASEATESFFGLPVTIVGYDDEKQEIDTTLYEGAQTVVAYVGARNTKIDGKDRNSYKAVVVFPIPTMESFLNGGDAAVAWLSKIIEKEASHVAFRNFREANTLAELMNGAKAAPTTVEAYVTASTRDGSGLDTETFDALWLSFRNMLKKEQPALNELLPSKADVIKAIRSKSFAESSPETAPLETAGIFTKIGNALIIGAKDNKDGNGAPAPLDPSAIQDWLDNRDSLVLERDVPKAKDFSVLSSLNF